MFKLNSTFKKAILAAAVITTIMLPVSAKTDKAVLHLRATVHARTSVAVAENGDVDFSINSPSCQTSIESTADGYTLSVVAA
ncbi:MAG: hypothetical protein IJ831_06380 [Spirochaetales bacterium]|nr:hypothetical protein [Spirochaetales bacterium]